MAKSWKSHIGSSFGIILGILVFSAGINPSNSSMLNAGIVLIVGSLAYRSAKKRKMQEVENTIFRRLIEGSSIIGLIALICLQNDLMFLVEEDPVPNFFIPVYVLSAYLIVIARKQNRGDLPD